MQKVNLYTDEFRPKKVVLPLYQIVGIPVVLGGLLVILTLFAQAGMHELTEKAENKSKSLERLQEQVAALQKKAGSLVRDESLVASNERLKKKLKARESMLDVLESVVVEEGEGFSRVLIALARQRVEELWLTKIQIVGPVRGYSLYGETKQAESVPTYLQKLRQEEVFVGHSFNLFSLEADENQHTRLSFSLRSNNLEEGGAPGQMMFSQLLTESPDSVEVSSPAELKSLVSDG